MSETPLELGLLVTERQDGDYKHIVAHPVTVNDANEIRNASTFKGRMIKDLQVYSQAGIAETRPYGFAVEFKPHNVDLTAAKAMVKTLASVERGLAKLDVKWGYVNGYGEYVARVGEVLGATKILFYRDPSNSKHGWSYADCEFLILPLGSGRNHIDWLIEQWAKARTGATV